MAYSFSSLPSWRRILSWKKSVYGFYDPESQLGYALNGEAASNSSVDIMVVNYEFPEKWDA